MFDFNDGTDVFGFFVFFFSFLLSKKVKKINKIIQSAPRGGNISIEQTICRECKSGKGDKQRAPSPQVTAYHVGFRELKKVLLYAKNPPLSLPK